MENYKYIFSVVLYKNMNDVIEMIESVSQNVKYYKIILVNNYFDDATLKQARKVAKDYKCDFIETENKGYGAGNNRAAEYAMKKYTFDYFIVSNPDITIRKFDEAALKEAEIPAIYAPDIICRSGKHQNPMWIHRNDLLEWIQYNGEKYKSALLNYGAIAFRKIGRKLFLVASSKKVDNNLRSAWSVLRCFECGSKKNGKFVLGRYVSLF